MLQKCQNDVCLWTVTGLFHYCVFIFDFQMNSTTNGSHGRANRFPSTYLEYSGSVPLVYWQVAALLRDKDPPNRMHKTQVLNAVWFTGSLCAYWAHLSILCRLLRTQQHVTELCRMFALMLRWLEVLSDPSPTGTLLRLNPSCYDHFTQQWITRFRSEEN